MNECQYREVNWSFKVEGVKEPISAKNYSVIYSQELEGAERDYEFRLALDDEELSYVVWKSYKSFKTASKAAFEKIKSPTQ